MNIGILAIQGAFAEHEQKLTALGADVFEIRQAKRSAKSDGWFDTAGW